MYYENGQMKKSRQQMIDDRMCKPGYTYNETLKKCLPAAGGAVVKGEVGAEVIPPPPPPTNGKQPGDATVAKEVATRKTVK